MKNKQLQQEKEYSGVKISGFLALLLQLFLIILAVVLAKKGDVIFGDAKSIALFVSETIIAILLTIVSTGYVQIEPNDARVLLFFGKYVGTLKSNGFFWINPFVKKIKLTQRARNLDVEPIKVNDKAGNPVMIGLVLVWKINDTYKAAFDIDNKGGQSSEERMNSYQNFVNVQSDAALRNIAGEYAYDNNETQDQITLRSGGDEINERLEKELNSRLDIAGIEVVEARINYLAYAPEIAAVMLRRQQAAAIIAAREKIVEGAVGMVQLALEKLATEQVVELDEDKKAAMVSNLLVVLCSDEQTQPIVNTGTLHQ